MHITRELAPEAWSEYLDAVNKELLNAPVTIDTGAAPNPPAIKTTRLTLRTLTYDHQHDALEIQTARRDRRPPNVMHHLVEHPVRIAVDRHTLLAPMTIAVEGTDGIRMLITIEDDADLPD